MGKRGPKPKEGVRRRVQMVVPETVAQFIDSIGPDELGRLIAWARPRYALLPVTSPDAATDERATVLRPATPVTVEVVTLWATQDGKGLRARLLERHEGFRTLIRARGFEWNEPDRCWSRALRRTEGQPAHRVAELGAALLSAGFIVSVPSATVADLIVTGTWVPAQTRWISALESGNVLLRWEKGGDDVWAATQHLRGARWNVDLQGSVISAARHVDIREFAERFEFATTPEADALLVAAAEAERRQLLVLDVPQPLQPKRQARPRKTKAEVSVPDDLLAD